MNYTLAELEEKYFPERMKRLVDCPKCHAVMSFPAINDPCSLCYGKARVEYQIYREYWRNKKTKESNDPPPKG